MERLELQQNDIELLEEARATSDRLYLKNIHEVAAALRIGNGKIFTGIHFDTRVGWANVCGEVAAICNMVNAGYRDLDTIVAVWRNPEGQHFILPPCGRCREVISEFNRDAWVIVTKKQNHWASGSIDYSCKVRIADLLPMKPM